MTLEEMGALLREERERKGVSLESAALEIKISKKYLVALEEGRTDDLPHPVYAKGFVKNYARLLGLDPEQMGAVLAAHYAVDEDQLQHGAGYDVHGVPPQPKERSATRHRAGSFGGVPSGFRPSLWLAIPVLAVFVALAWYFFAGAGQGFGLEKMLGIFKSSGEVQAPKPKPAPEPAKPGAQQGSSSSSGAAPAATTGQPQATQAAKSEPAQAEQGAPVQRDLLAITPGPGGAKTPASLTATPAQEPAFTPEKLAAEAQFAASGKQIVEINAAQPAVLEVTAENGQIRTFTLLKGQRLNLRFNDKVSVRFAQAPGVAIKVNGKDYPLEGGKAEGKSITFP